MTRLKPLARDAAAFIVLALFIGAIVYSAAIAGSLVAAWRLGP